MDHGDAAIGRELDDHLEEGGVNDSLGHGFAQEVSCSHHVSSYLPYAIAVL